MVAMPVALPVKVTLQLASRVDPATVASVQMEALREPAPVEVKVTLPAAGVGAVDVSLTVAVHFDAWFTATGLEQVILVEVSDNCATPTLAAILVLPM